MIDDKIYALSHAMCSRSSLVTPTKGLKRSYGWRTIHAMMLFDDTALQQRFKGHMCNDWQTIQASPEPQARGLGFLIRDQQVSNYQCTKNNSLSCPKDKFQPLLSRTRSLETLLSGLYQNCSWNAIDLKKIALKYTISNRMSPFYSLPQILICRRQFQIEISKQWLRRSIWHEVISSF